jgi:hypothetical protein
MAGLPAAIGIHFLLPLCGSQYILQQNHHDAGLNVLPISSQYRFCRS